MFVSLCDVFFSSFFLSQCTPNLFPQAEIPVPAKISTASANELAQDRALVVCPNKGTGGVLCCYLERWGLAYDCGPSFSAAMNLAKTEDSKFFARGLVPRQITIVIADIDGDRIPMNVLTKRGLRFIFLCSDSHRRFLAKDTSEQWFGR